MVSYVGFKVMDMGFDAHLTVVYFGKDAAKSTLTRIRKIIDDPIWSGPAWAVRDKIDLFGPNRDVPVMRVVVPTVMHELRYLLEQFSVSQFTDWNPHITLDLHSPNTLYMPPAVKLIDLGIY